jgi:hypothetical protein
MLKKSKQSYGPEERVDLPVIFSKYPLDEL